MKRMLISYRCSINIKLEPGFIIKTRFSIIKGINKDWKSHNLRGSQFHKIIKYMNLFQNIAKEVKKLKAPKIKL